MAKEKEVDEKEKETESNAFDEQEFTDYCCDILKEAMSDRIGFNGYIDRWYKDWRDIKDKKIIPWVGASNFSVPATSISADGVIPRIIEGNFDTITPIDAKPINKTAVPFKDAVKKFLNWDLDSHEELFKEIWFFVQNTVWSGTGFVKNFFLKEKTKIEERIFDVYIVNGEIAKDPNSDTPIEVNERNTGLLDGNKIPYEVEEVTEKKRRWKKFNPELLCCDIKDVIFPSDCVSIQDAWENSLIALRVWRTKDFLKRQLKQDDKELYKNLDKIKIDELHEKQDKAKNERERRRIANFFSKTKKLECFEIYVNYDIDGDGLEEKVVALIHYESKTLCGYEKFPYEHGRCPIIPGYIKPIHNQPFGVGIPEMLYDVKGEIDATHNQRVDRGSLHNNPTLLHTKGSGFDSTQHKPGPGRHWDLDNIGEESIKYLKPPQHSESQSFQEEQNLWGYVQRRSNLSDFNLGSESKTAGEGAGTARGLQILVSEGNVGFRHFIRWMSLSIGEIFRQRWALYQQYWGGASDDEVKKWIKEIFDTPDNPLGEQGLDAIKQQFNIVMTATKEDIKAEISKAQAVHEILKENPLLEQFPFKMRDISIDLLRKMGIKDPEDKLPTEQEIKQWQTEIHMESLKQLEEQKAQANIEEAGKQGYQAEKTRLGAYSGEEQ